MAKIFNPRTIAPSRTNKYFYDDNIFYKCNYGMPNCTCYAWGRWYELLASKPRLYTGNAETWYPKGKAFDGYERGQTPRLGAIACWSKGVAGNSKDGAGHVAIVEKIYSDGSILTSNSAWKGTNFYTKKIAKGYKVSGYTFQGFIYLPIEYVENVENHVETTYKVGKIYKTQVILKVRTGAGTENAQKTYNQLTTNAKMNAYSSGENKGCLKAGTKVTIFEIKNVGSDIWGRIPSGWIALKYNNKIYVK